MLADILGGTGSLTGVDVAKHRLSACRSVDLKEDVSTFSEWSSRRSWKDRQKAKKANATGSQHPLASSEPELIYYGKHSGLVGLRKSDVLCPTADDEACTSGYDKSVPMTGP
nr:unnamed protein product [Digitaria exilis]